MSEDGLNDLEDMVPVALPSGGLFKVHKTEFQYFKSRADKYLSDNDFHNVSDFQDVDRLLILELLCHRWGLWISTQRDYWGDVVDENTLQKSLKDHSTEVRQLKKSLGLDRETREKLRGQDSVETFIAQLGHRAKHFGYMRNDQAAKSIEILMSLMGIVTLHDNCDERERIEQGCTPEQIMKWVREQFTEFEKIDQEFRKEQAMWVRSM